jgi:hypothetical protein
MDELNGDKAPFSPFRGRFETVTIDDVACKVLRDKLAESLASNLDERTEAASITTQSGTFNVLMRLISDTMVGKTFIFIAHAVPNGVAVLTEGLILLPERLGVDPNKVTIFCGRAITSTDDGAACTGVLAIGV